MFYRQQHLACIDVRQQNWLALQFVAPGFPVVWAWAGWEIASETNFLNALRVAESRGMPTPRIAMAGTSESTG